MILGAITFSADIYLSSLSSNAWVEPATVPPGNNIFAPLNSSTFGQSKAGGLILNLGNAAHGLIVRYGLVGIGTDNPQAQLDVVGKIKSTGLEVTSTTEGVLFPRMTTAQRDAITAPQEGMEIFNTTTKKKNIFNGTKWELVGGDSTPTGTIAYFDLAACPEGWSEATNAKGRYIVGTQNAANRNLLVGQALGDGENRAVGQHAHGVYDPGHAHGVWDGGHAHGVYDPGHSHYSYSYLPNWMPNHPRIWALGGGGLDGWEWFPTSGSGTGIGIYGSGANVAIYGAGTGIGINNAGSVAGTNAPYVEFLVCRKN